MPGDMYDCIPSRSTPALRARSPLRIPCRLPGHYSLASFVGRSAGQRWRPLQARVGDELAITTKASAQTAVDMMVWNMTCDGKSGIGVGGVPNLQRHCSYLQTRQAPALMYICRKIQCIICKKNPMYIAFCIQCILQECSQCILQNFIQIII